jgi:hypothetical protein
MGLMEILGFCSFPLEEGKADIPSLLQPRQVVENAALLRVSPE